MVSDVSYKHLQTPPHVCRLTRHSVKKSIEKKPHLSGFVHSFIFFFFFFFIRSVEKVLSVQTTLSSTKSFILMINLLNVTHARGHSTKKSASESTFLVKNMKSNRKSCRILLRKRIEPKTNPNDREKLLQKLRNQAIPKTSHKKVQVIRRMTQPRIAARFQTILVYLHLLTQAKVPYWRAVTLRPRLSDLYQS